MASIVSEIKKRIDEAKKRQTDFTDLDLSSIQIGKFTPQINALLEKIKTLQVLYLSECGLNTLEGFPNIKLIAIDLSKNNVGDDGNIEVLLKSPDISQIIFTDNKIEKIQTVLSLSVLTKLIEIDFEGNPVSQIENYSSSVFEKFPIIEYVDRKDKDGNEQPEDEEEFDGEDEDDDEEEDFDEGEDQDDEEFDQEDDESEEKPIVGRKKK